MKVQTETDELRIIEEMCEAVAGSLRVPAKHLFIRDWEAANTEEYKKKI